MRLIDLYTKGATRAVDSNGMGETTVSYDEDHRLLVVIGADRLLPLQEPATYRFKRVRIPLQIYAIPTS